MITAALLGFVQALTEFLPVSSSGHLRLAHALAGLEAPNDLLFDIVLHAGTLLAVVVVYHRRIAVLIASGLRGLTALPSGLRGALGEHEGLRYLLLVVVATAPTGVIGLLLSAVVDSELISVPWIGGLLCLNGAILWFSRRFGFEATGDDAPTGGVVVDGITLRRALIIGIVQGLAVLPGISRSGTTIVCALVLGIDRMRAAEFSFFLSIPAIIGAVVTEFDPAAIGATADGAGQYAVGAVSAAVFGVVALAVLLRVVRRARLHNFAWYCWALGVVALAWGLL